MQREEHMEKAYNSKLVQIKREAENVKENFKQKLIELKDVKIHQMYSWRNK